MQLFLTFVSKNALVKGDFLRGEILAYEFSLVDYNNTEISAVKKKQKKLKQKF